MISKQEIPVAGLKLTVHGLEEYKAKGAQGPVAIMFALHGRLQKSSSMDPIAQALCGLNDRTGIRRHMIVIAFDQPNHGTRLVHRLSNFGWKEGAYQNPTHAQDMWSFFYNASRTVSELIDVVEDYLFGPEDVSRVQVWGVTGFSMGGHGAFMAAANDPRIHVAIPIVGTADFLGLLHARMVESNLPKKDHLPKRFCDMVNSKIVDLENRLKNTKILIISGENDRLVPSAFNEGFYRRLCNVHCGKEGRDYGFIVVPGVGHEWCPAMFDLSVTWCDQWMSLQNSNTSNAETILKTRL